MKKTVADLAGRWLVRKAGNLSEIENQVLQSTIDRKPVARDINESLTDIQRTSDRLADSLACVGGSWSFILSFIAFLILWTTANLWFLGRDTFDPYPFIFLNLLLSMLAALQAPVIMMSQNRQAARDRVDAAHDYAVNLKAEIEIMALHEKLDEMRFQEMLQIRDQISQLAARIEKINPLPRETGAK